MTVENPVRFANSQGGPATGAVLFVHGFSGKGVTTWSGFPEALQDDADLESYDYHFWQYDSTLNLTYAVQKFFWQDDPNITTLGQQLRTLLDSSFGGYEKLVLVGHSMGGLVIQSLLLEEIARQREVHLDRVTEVVLFATPSGGLHKARFGSFLKNQVADMSDLGPFITNLRAAWKELIDDRRDATDKPWRFRLTLVAGTKDKFVPPESALDPFPFDEHEFVSGNHAELVKPTKVGAQPINVLKVRLLRGNPTEHERRVVYGEAPEVVHLMNQVSAAADLGNADEMAALAAKLLGADPEFPTVERALGLALSAHMRYQPAINLMQRYLEFTMPDGATPFAGDVQIAQQLAVALSGTGDNVAALATLKGLPDAVRADAETLGIMAGRLKREWIANPGRRNLAKQALDAYQAGYAAGRDDGDTAQILYNGINAATMSFLLEKPYEELAAELVAVVDAIDEPDYWALATRAEALLLLARYDEAATAYDAAVEATGEPRYLATTAVQAMRIIEAQDEPAAANSVAAVIDKHYAQHGDLEVFAAGVAADEADAELEDTA